jgi:hypothetical protein
MSVSPSTQTIAPSDGTASEECCIPASVEDIGDSYFGHCHQLSHVRFESGSKISVLGERLFSESSLKSICIPSSIEAIAPSCFLGCSEAASVVLEAGSKLGDDPRNLSEMLGCNVVVQSTGSDRKHSTELRRKQSCSVS